MRARVPRHSPLSRHPDSNGEISVANAGRNGTHGAGTRLRQNGASRTRVSVPGAWLDHLRGDGDGGLAERTESRSCHAVFHIEAVLSVRVDVGAQGRPRGA